MKLIIYCIAVGLISSCSIVENHSQDGIYVGAVMMNPIAWVVNGNNVTIHYTGSAVTEKIEHGVGYIKLMSNGAIMHIETDKKTGRKVLIYKTGIFDTKLQLMTTDVNIPENEVAKMIAKPFDVE